VVERLIKTHTTRHDKQKASMAIAADPGVLAFELKILRLAPGQ
jgi:hypothetical protein